MVLMWLIIVVVIAMPAVVRWRLSRRGDDSACDAQSAVYRSTRMRIGGS
jgi:hypothetical protein